MGDKERFNELVKDPHLFDQGAHGSCGFAGTLMGLLQYAPKEIVNLHAAITRGSRYRNVKESYKVKTRLEKRMKLGLIEGDLDVRLSIGLMITFKEYLREDQNTAQVWEDCRKYSELFESSKKKDWMYGGKLHDHQNKVNAPPAEIQFGFSYKHGDMALTIDAVRHLLGMVGFKSAASGSLVSNEDVAKEKKDLAQLTGCKALKDTLTVLASALAKGTYAGAMMGVAYKDFVGVAAHEPYEYIGHWVYLPRQNVPADVFDTVTWTWGREMTFKELLADGYAPKVAVTFKQP